MFDNCSKFFNKHQTAIQYIIFIVFFIFNLILMLLHEPWRDEIHAWNMAKYLSLKDLFIVSRFDGHPILWHLILMPFAKLNSPIITLNFISLIIVSISALLFIFKTKMNNIFKIIVLFTVPFSYAFPAISRNYCLVLLFLTIIGIFYDKRYEHPIIYAIFISLLIHTHSLAWGVVAGLTITFYIYELFLYIFKKKRDIKIKPIVIGLLLIAFNTFLVVFQLFGTSNPDYSTKYTENMSLIYKISVQILLILAIGLFIILKSSKKNIKEYLVLAIGLLFHILVYFTFYSSISIEREILIYAIFLFFIILLSKTDIPRKILNIFCIFYLISVLLFGMLGKFFTLLYQDILCPFSSAQYMARYINENLIGEDTILIDSSIICQTIEPYLENARLYDVVYEDYLENIKYMSSNYADAYVKLLLSEEYKGKYIILSLNSSLKMPENYELIYETPLSIHSENYTLYYIK